MRAGLVGCGRIGYKFDLDPKRSGIWTHAKAYSKHADFVGIYDPNEHNARECSEIYKTKPYNSINALLDTELDVVSVAVPQQFHYDAISHIIRHPRCPKVLWVEKPFTGEYDKATELIKEATGKTNIHVNYQRRFTPAYGWIKSLGTPQHIGMIYSGGLLNTASHYIDVILWLYGIPNRTIKIADDDFVMQYNFNVSFSMLKAQYYYCQMDLYYGGQKITIPPVATEIYVTKAIPSPKYSEYMELCQTETKSFEYNPMVNQLLEIDKYISGENAQLNNGLESLMILKELQ